VTFDSTADVGMYSSLALASDDSARIAYYDDGGVDLKYAQWNGATWDIETVDASKAGTYVSLALDSNDYPHISYYRETGTSLQYARWNGATWDIETVDTSGNTGMYTSITLTSDDVACISYYDVTNNNLNYAEWNEATLTWDITPVDTVDDVGQFTSIMDSEGNPYISYYDVTNGTLELASWSEALSDWVITTVANGINDVGMYSSLVVDSSGYVYISYYNATTGNLEYYTTIPTISVTLRNYDDSAPYPGWAIGSGKETNTIYIMATGDSVLVKNTGNVAEDFSIEATATNWTLNSSNTVTDYCVLMALFNGDTKPATGDFSTSYDLISSATTWASYEAGGTGCFQGAEDGDNVAALSGAKAYFYLQTPSSVDQGNEETITVTIGCRAH